VSSARCGIINSLYLGDVIMVKESNVHESPLKELRNGVAQTYLSVKVEGEKPVIKESSTTVTL
jgi:hypothetical protein